jgi:hypothetical protein
MQFTSDNRNLVKQNDDKNKNNLKNYSFAHAGILNIIRLVEG